MQNKIIGNMARAVGQGALLLFSLFAKPLFGQNPNFTRSQPHAFGSASATTKIIVARLDAQQAQTELKSRAASCLNLSLDSSEIAGTGSYQGVDSAQTTLALSSIWERGNQRQTRQSPRQHQTELLLTRQELQRMQLLKRPDLRLCKLGTAGALSAATRYAAA